MKDEKLQILKMVEEGKITSQEAMELLDALGDVQIQYEEKHKAKWLKIKVIDSKDNAKVNVTIPLSLIDVSMRLAGKLAPNFVPELNEAGLSEEDLGQLFQAIQEGASGKLVDIESEDGEKVEIVVE